MEDKERQEIKDHVLLMLGAPTTSVSLDAQQLDSIVDSSTKYVETCMRMGRQLSPTRKLELIKDVAVGTAYVCTVVVKKQRLTEWDYHLRDSASDRVWKETCHIDKKLFQLVKILIKAGHPAHEAAAEAKGILRQLRVKSFTE